MYNAKVDWGMNNMYCESLFILNINVKDTRFDSYDLKSDYLRLSGHSIDCLRDDLGRITDSLSIRSNKARDIQLVYIDDLDKIRAFLYNDIDIDGNRYIICNKIEFRSWKPFTKDDPYNVMKDWQNRFVEDKYPYLTPSQYIRKRISKRAKNAAASIYPDSIPKLNIMNKAVHGGVLYHKDDGESVVYNMLGYDIISAYIYSLLFEKHACSPLTITNTNEWSMYLGAEDRGSIGRYEIEYNCIFSVIRCYKDVNGNNLKNGHHIVDVVLSNIDLNILLNIKQFQCISITCKSLYTFDLDYLPKEVRLAAATEFIKKQTLPEDSSARNNQKVIVNSIYGNMSYRIKDILKLDVSEQKKFIKDNIKSASLCPQWGVFTMAYTKSNVINLGIQSVGWRYSDTDSIYCFNDAANIRLFNEFNSKRRERNIELCKKLGYSDIDILCELGTFKHESTIKRFIAWGNKMYAYETTDGKVVLKAAGCNKSQINCDPNVIFDINYRPSKGTCKFTGYDKDHYYEADSYAYMLMMKSM